MGQEPRRFGMTIPFGGPLHAQRERIEELEALGYTDVWSAEANGADGLTPLALASIWAPSLRLGTAILPASTRGPALLAQSLASLASAAPGRFVAGIGSSSDVIVEQWNGIPFVEPYKRVRDTLRFLRAAFTGEKVTEQYETFAVRGFRLGVPMDAPPPILVAALREGMLRLAGREGDGAIVNWLSVADTERVAGIVDAAGGGAPREIVARIFVIPTSGTDADTDAARALARHAMAAYLNVPVYRAFHEWCGRADLLAGHWERWAAGDRRGSLERIPDEVVDDLVVHGDPDTCRAHITRYQDAGVTTPALMLLPLPGTDVRQAVRDLAPR
ncbi:MAG: LLM class F420-dependent oxidoreductase [Acidimicrobiales bacterium]|jgi:probable F420-dependent oxidoreductase|nr:LLM class F420-dependent oxidoreductase [Acidimicrobiales bacterium]